MWVVLPDSLIRQQSVPWLGQQLIASEKPPRPQGCGEKMGTSPMELKWLLMWLLFGFIKGKKPGVCPSLPPTEFADVTAEMYPAQTKLYYTCDPGYGRKASEYLGIQCKIEQQGAVWKHQLFKCFEQKDLSSMDPMMELELTQKPEREPRSPAPQKQEDLSESKQKDFCGPPKTVPHASIRLPQQHYVGQVLHFKCQTGYDKRPPTSGSRTCKEVNGKTFWTPLDMRCTNDSNQWSPQTTGPGLTHLSSFLSSSGTQPVTGFTALWFVLLIIPTAFV
uniref:interleukin-2 receptor subunit alpha n=1 Tax=Lonchura striata TaxID=40157 RepID=UPI0012939948|nr:interleukin-2 receptor subunit alpha [Lonchura striata domestica]